MPKKKSKKETIQEKIEKLEAIVQKFEKNEIDIESGIKEYEIAAEIIKTIKKELSEQEVKIDKIRDSY